MPSAFETAFAGQVGQLYNAFGLPATYTDPSGTATPCTIRVHREPAHQVERPSRAVGELQTAAIEVRQSEVAKVVRNGRFLVEGVEVWTIEITPVVKNGQHYCQCSRSGTERIMPRSAKE